MSEVLIAREPVLEAIRPALIELAGVERVYRTAGARARDIRGIFGTEGLMVAFAGWLLGVPLGYAFARLIGWAAGEAVGLDIAFVFPLGHVAIALVGTVLLALGVMLAPLRRAVRFKPGDAIRYA